MQEERKQKQNRNMQGNLALTFLFKDQNLQDIIQFQKKTGGKGSESPPERKTSSDQADPSTKSMILPDAKGQQFEWNGMDLSPTRQKTMREDARQTTALGGIKEEELSFWIQKFTDASGKLLEPEKVHGYYQEKKKYKVKSVNNFIEKLRRTELCLGFFA